MRPNHTTTGNPVAVMLLDNAAAIVAEAATRRGRLPGGVLHRMRRDLPYSVMPVPGQPGTRILANRGYKPLGESPDGEFARYEEWPSHWFTATDEQLQAVPWPRTSGYLFNDGCAPWLGRAALKAYEGRLMALRATISSAFRLRQN